MQVEDEVSVCGKIMFGGEEEKLWLRWRSVEEVKKGGSKEKGERENSFFVLFVFFLFSFTRVHLQINTIRLYNTKYEWIYIQKLMKLKIFIIPWRSISFTIFTNISSHFSIQTMHSRLCSSYFIIFFMGILSFFMYAESCKKQNTIVFEKITLECKRKTSKIHQKNKEII